MCGRNLFGSCYSSMSHLNVTKYFSSLIFPRDIRKSRDSYGELGLS